MAITLTCACGKAIRVDDKHANKRMKCPVCARVLLIPGAESPSTPRSQSEQAKQRPAEAVAGQIAAAAARDRTVADILQSLDSRLQEEERGRRHKRITATVIAVVLAPPAALFVAILWTIANIALHNSPTLEGGAAAVLGLGSCGILLVVPFVAYKLAKSVLLRLLGHGRPAAKAPPVRELLHRLEGEFPEYLRAIGGSEAALDPARREGHAEHYFFSVPGSREKRAATEARLAALKDPNYRLRIEAVNALSEMEDPQAIGSLFASAADDGAVEVRQAFARALAKSRDPRASAMLKQLLQNQVRQFEAAEILTDIGDQRAVDTLLDFIRTDKSSKRRDALNALMRFPAPVATQHLLGLFTESDPQVQRCAALGLAKLRDPHAVDALLELIRKGGGPPSELVEAVSKLAAPVALQRLLAMLADADSGVRARAAESLGLLKDRSAVKPLLVALADGNPRVKASAARALGCLGDPRAVEPLLAAAWDSFERDVKIDCYHALRQIGHPGVVEGLRDRMLISNGEVKLAAARAIVAIADRSDDPRLREVREQAAKEVRFSDYLEKEEYHIRCCTPDAWSDWLYSENATSEYRRCKSCGFTESRD